MSHALQTMRAASSYVSAKAPFRDCLYAAQQSEKVCWFMGVTVTGK